VVLPIFIERIVNTNEMARIRIGREIEVILGNLADYLVGIALLYLCYNNTKFALRVKRRRHKRRMRKIMRDGSAFSGSNNPAIMTYSNAASS
jgi:hypothetical protein